MNSRVILQNTPTKKILQQDAAELTEEYKVVFLRENNSKKIWNNKGKKIKQLYVLTCVNTLSLPGCSCLKTKAFG